MLYPMNKFGTFSLEGFDPPIFRYLLRTRRCDGVGLWRIPTRVTVITYT